jgi:WD40 repeat protein/serine/threonine protein kinase
MSKLKVFLLGTPQLEIDNTPIELKRRKAMALLAYLAVTEKSHSRDSLAVLLWPEADQGRARTLLRRNLWALNKALGEGWLDISREAIGLAAKPELWVDVNQFQLALAAGQTHEHTAAAVCPDCLPHLREAVSLYRDDFLSGFTLRDSPEFDEWQRFQTEQLRRELTEALERLVRDQSAQEDFKVAIPYAQCWLSLDPLHEPAHRHLMELYARAGQRAAALHQYNECERILHEELGVPPSMETTTLAERIRLETEGQQGQLIKSYELQELIGAGGFGEVYRAYQPQVRREVAIKVILPQFANQPEFIRRFEAEAQMVAQLEHPHIVPLYDYWREPGGAYLVMRWLRGGSLEDALQGGPWSPEATAQLLDQIAAALMLAHQRGIIHRDLKPANILLDEGGNVYLTDFGIAKAVTAPRSASQTQDGAVFGSPAYMAPEAANDEPLTPQTDIYSLGVMLFEILTGQHPFSDTTPPMMLIKHLSEPLPPLQLSDLDLSAALNEVIQHATAKKPADRYADTISLATDFHRALGSEQVPLTAIPDEATPLLVPNPYKGLHAFQEGDAADFFGREALVEQLLMRLVLNLPTKRQPSSSQPPQPPHLQNFLAVVGPSGSGKSSLVKAGLIPALRQNAIPDSKDWFIVEMTPSSHPLEELETALLRIAINPPPTLLDQLQADERGLLRAVKRILPDDESELLLVIDQFEEVFTLAEDEAVRSHFLDSLHVAVTEPGSPLRVVITLRADFYDRPLHYPGFGDLLRQRMETVLPLSSEELEHAIAGPAERVGATFETGLIPIIVSDVQEQPGTLPLMQYALTELFDRRQGRRLTLDTYQASGSIFGALARRADELYTDLDDAGRAATRRLFLRLVTLGEGVEDTRRRVLRSELASPDGTGEQNIQPETDGRLTNAIIDIFGQYRLLTFDRDPVTRGPTVEVAHEALIREWDRLRQWLDEDREFLMWQQRLRAGLHQWEANEQDEGALLRGAPLAEAENWLSQRQTDLNETEREFIQASQALRERQVAEREAQRQRDLETAQKLAKTESRAAQRLRWLAVGLVIFLIVAAGLAIFAFNQQAEAEANLVQAETNLALSESQRLAAEANAILQGGGNTELAALLSLRALNTAYTSQADMALQRASKGDFSRQLFSGHTGEMGGVAFSPDGRYAVSGSSDETARLWDIESGQELQILTGHTAGVKAVAFSPDGRYVLTGSDDNTARLWEAATGQELQILADHGASVYEVAFSPNGKYIVTAADGTGAWLWDLETRQQIGVFDEGGYVTGLAISQDGKNVLTGDNVTNEVGLWDLETGQELRRFIGPSGGVSSVAFSPDGRYIVAGDGNSGVHVWDLRQPDAEARLFVGHTEPVNDVKVSPDGRYVLSAGWDRTARLWNIESGREERRYVGIATFRSVAFSPDGRTALLGDEDGTLRLWDVEPPPDPRDFSGHTGVVAAAKFSPDGRYVLTGSLDQTGRLWSAATGEALHLLLGHTDWAYGVAFSPDGRYAVTSSFDRAARMWDVETGQEVRVFEYPVSIFGVAFSPDGKYIVTGGADAIARVWDVESGREVQTFSGHTEFVTGVAFTPDGRYVLSGSEGEEMARLWDVETGQEVRQFPGYAGFINGLSISPDGKHILTAARETTSQLWALETGQALGRFSGDSSMFSPDGKTMLTGGENRTYLWDRTTGEQLRSFGGADAMWTVAFSPDGAQILIGGSNNLAQLWDTDVQILASSVCDRVLRDFTDREREQYGINDQQPTCPANN